MIPVGAHGIICTRTTDRAATIARMVAAGQGRDIYTREDIYWSTAEPTQGAYVWTSFDAWIGDCAAGGLRIWANMLKPPTWAVGGADTDASWPRAPITDPSKTAFAAFCGAFAARYGAGGTFWAANPSINYLPIEYFEIWNEAYKSQAWKQISTGNQMFASVADYAAMFNAAADAIHAAVPSAKVAAGVDTWTDNTASGAKEAFLGPFLDVSGVLSRLNVLSVHPYASFYRPVTYDRSGYPQAAATEEWKRTAADTCRVVDYRSIAVSKGVPNIPIWVTEIGWPTHATGTTEAQQANLLGTLYQYLRGHQRLVQGLIVYTFQTAPSLSDQGVDPTSAERYFGMIHNDGDGGTGTAKPVFTRWVAENAIGVDG